MTFWHWSPDRLEPGTVVLPAAVTGQACWTFVATAADLAWRSTRVWMFAAAEHAAVFGGLPGFVHHVDPIDPQPLSAPQDWADGIDEGLPAQWHAHSATVVRVVDEHTVRVMLARAVLG